MSSVMMQPQPMRLIRNESSVSTISPFILIFSLKAIFSRSMIKTNIPWGQAISKPMWFRSFIVKEVLKNGAYRLVDFEEIP
jgi:hypothetical protein